MKSFFTPKDVCTILAISYRQIQYWDKTNFIKPSYRRKGKYRLYTFADLIQLWVAVDLRKLGYSIQSLRRTIKSLRNLLPQVNNPLVELTFLFEGETILVFDGNVLIHEGHQKRRKRHLMVVEKLRDHVDMLYPEKAVEEIQ